MSQQDFSRLKTIASVFFRIGLMGFGGPFVLIAMMEEEFVRRRRWITEEKFAELYAICKLLPGPIAPQMAISVARECGGTLGGAIAGVLFLFPALVLVVAVAVFYKSGHELPRQGIFLKGLQAGALAAIAVSIYQLFKPLVRSPRAWILAALNGTTTFFFPACEPLYILGTGFIGVIRNWRTARSSSPSQSKPKLHGGFAGMVSTAAILPGAGKLLPKVFWICYKCGQFVFGTGMAILPILEHDFVTKTHWLTHAQFMDSIAVGQVTPGPFTTSVAFIGYLLAGYKGAVVASFGIFLPSFLNVLIFVPMIWGRISHSPLVPYFINWALPAVVGCISAACVKLGFLTLLSTSDWVIFVLGLAALVSKRVPGWAVIIGAGFLNSLFG